VCCLKHHTPAVVPKQVQKCKMEHFGTVIILDLVDKHKQVTWRMGNKVWHSSSWEVVPVFVLQLHDVSSCPQNGQKHPGFNVTHIQTYQS